MTNRRRLQVAAALERQLAVVKNKDSRKHMIETAAKMRAGISGRVLKSHIDKDGVRVIDEIAIDSTSFIKGADG